jgi:(p)ppGpp synthase/HD superfamily hydrolase
MLVNCAKKFAQERHYGQKRSDGEDFFNHLKRVAESVINISIDPTLMSAAYLHDVVEDGKASPTEIQRYFGYEVYQIVMILTRRQNENYESYIHRIAGSRNVFAIIIKIADHDDNLASLNNARFSDEAKYNLRSRWNWSRNLLMQLLKNMR